MTRIFVRDEDGCNTATDAGEYIRQQQVAGIFGRTNEIGLLSNAWIDPQSHLFLLNGPTGIGKSTLLQKWLHSLQKKDWHDAEAVYVWSFYPPDLAHTVQDPVEEFFHHALHWFGGEEAAQCPNLLQGEFLAKLVQSHHTLLILDGLEILQSRTGSATGKLSDPRLAVLLERLATRNPGLCIAISRDPLLGSFGEHPGVHRHELEKMPLDDGVELLRYKCVQGEDDKLRQIVLDYGQNPLTLSLLGGYLAVWHEGDWRQMEKIPVLMDQQQDGRQARRILVANATELAGKPGESLLYLLSMLYRPTHWDTLEALIGAKRGWPLQGLFQKKQQDSYASLISKFGRLSQQKRYEATLQLRELGLVSLAGRCFWLPQWVREAYQRQLRYDWPLAWKEANQRLMLFHATLPKEQAMAKIIPLTQVKPPVRLPVGPFGATGTAAAVPVVATAVEVDNQTVVAGLQTEETTPVPLAAPEEVVPVTIEAPEEAVAPAVAATREEETPEEEPALTIAVTPEEPPPAVQPTPARILPFPARPAITRNDLEGIGGLMEQLKRYQNSLQMLQIRTKKFQKCVRQLDKEVQSMHYPHTRTGTDA